MFEFKIKIPCTRPEIAMKSLEPDIRNDKYSTVTMKAGKDFIEIHVKSNKVGHMKAIVNTYISLINTLEDLEKKMK